VLDAPPARASEEGLVQPERGERPDPGRVLDQRRAVGDNRVHDRVPVAPELAGHVRDGAAGPVNDFV
jgi:hypothetical protein